ncbi:MAG: hypothetical protein JNL97_07485 [Verrucomicrobiales bacterium]|nr:hypothetical protein [Verrucomicrobiales bacterium]
MLTPTAFFPTRLAPTLACVAAMFSSALAAPISVPNFSFESPDIVDGQAILSFPGWTAGGAGFNQFATWDFDNAAYPGALGDNGPLPGSSHGGQAVAIGIQSKASVGHLTSEALGVVADNTSYTLTIAIGNPLNFPVPDFSAIQLLVDGNVVSSSSVASGSIPDGTFTDFTTSFSTAPANDPLSGGVLGIRLQASGDSSEVAIGDWQAHFDNVRLDATTVPEPSARDLVVVAVVCLGMARVGRRVSVS